MNDDIVINENRLVSKLIKPFLADENVGMVCGNPTPLAPINFVDDVGISVFRIWDRVRMKIRDGQSVNTLDGKIMVFNKSLLSQIKFPKNMRDWGNVDLYLYLFAIKYKFKYEFIKDAVVGFRNPTTWKDYFRWHLRNFSQPSMLQIEFGDLVAKEYEKPKFIYIKSLIKEFFSHPINVLVILTEAVYLRLLKNRYATKEFKSTWDVIESTKTIE